jgi:hypothetical protein
MVASSRAELLTLHSRLISLFTGSEVDATEGSSVEGANNAAAAAAGGTQAAKIKITQIGGVLFTLE